VRAHPSVERVPGGHMSDVVMLVVVLLFFALSFGFVSLCDRLR
jgi:hypothetical protein